MKSIKSLKGFDRQNDGENLYSYSDYSLFFVFLNLLLWFFNDWKDGPWAWPSPKAMKKRYKKRSGNNKKNAHPNMVVLGLLLLWRMCLYANLMPSFCFLIFVIFLKVLEIDFYLTFHFLWIKSDMIFTQPLINLRLQKNGVLKARWVWAC